MIHRFLFPWLFIVIALSVYSQKADTTFLNSFYMDKALLKEVKYQQELIGTQIPPFTFQDIHGRIYTTEELSNKTLLVHFWFLTCGGCIKESPMLNALYDTLKNNPDIVILTFASNTSEELLKFEQRDSAFFGKKWATISKHPVLKFPISVASAEMTNLFRIWGYPVNFILGRNFTLKSIVHAHELDLDESGLLQLLKSKLYNATQ